LAPWPSLPPPCEPHPLILLLYCMEHGEISALLFAVSGVGIFWDLDTKHQAEEGQSKSVKAERKRSCLP